MNSRRPVNSTVRHLRSCEIGVTINLQLSKYLVLVIALFATSVVCGQRKAIGDDHLYNQVVTISGTVTSSTVGKSGEAISVSQYLLFQRVGCELCLIATRTDTEGRYQINVGRGKYRIIVRDGTQLGHMIDILAPDQPRVVSATKIVGYNEFDIRLVRSDSGLNIAIPDAHLPGSKPR